MKPESSAYAYLFNIPEDHFQCCFLREARSIYSNREIIQLWVSADDDVVDVLFEKPFAASDPLFIH